MKIFDAHCDVLYKLFLEPSLDFGKSQALQVNMERLAMSKTKVQVFAIYVPESVHPSLKFEAALKMVDLFYEKVLKPFPAIRLVRTKEEIDSLAQGEIGAILSLEGCDAIGQDLVKLKTLIRLGVTSVGLTWNYGNYVADGSLEVRGAGLSHFGRQVVQLLSDTNTMCDVAHLSERGFWDVIESGVPVFNSHANSHSLCPHPRNLSDEQILALIERDSVMGITFVPHFIKNDKKAGIADVIRHVEHVCSLGGENHLGFGSDFDGVETAVAGLEANDFYPNLVNEMQKYYSAIQVEKFFFSNMASRIFGKNA